MDTAWMLLALAALLLAPRVGLVPLWRRRSAGRRREEMEDALKHLLDQEYRGRRGQFASLAGTLRVSDRRLMQVLSRMQAQGLVEARGQEFHLTTEGERAALQIVRAHRLLERYLADEARLPLNRIHREAERREHSLTPAEVDELDASLGHPETDPHGDPIPTRDGYLAPATGRPLTDWPPGEAGRIVHLEDEPPMAYAQIVAAGLRIGQVVRILESTPERLALSDGENEYRLAPAVAANVFLTSVPATEAGRADVQPLSVLPPGSSATIVALDELCQGYTRRRLLDLGFTPGAELRADLTTFAGDPRAYRIRGTLVALRREQADHILVKRVA